MRSDISIKSSYSTSLLANPDPSTSGELLSLPESSGDRAVMTWRFQFEYDAVP